LTTDVTGTLPVVNGGTGSATQNFVDLSTTQAAIAGAKTFTSPLTVDGSGSTSIPQTVKGSATFNDLVQYKNNAGTAKWTWGLTSGNDLDLTEAGVANHRIYIAAGGNIGLRNITAPGAALHLPAGSTAATSGPLKFTSGSLMTTAEVGVVEFLTDKFYGTITTGPARKEFIQGDNAITEGVNLILGTTTGTKIGTATSQKLGFYNATPIVQPSAYTTSNVTTDRTYDANATTLDEVADVLGTLIADLKSLGLVG